MKTRKIWLGIGAFIVAGVVPQHAVKAIEPDQSVFERDRLQTGSARHLLLAEAAKSAGEGGEGGEAGIDAEAADKDAVKYGIALQVIAAHLHAGLAAYEGKEREAGAQMFAHGFTEVYAEAQDIFQNRGIRDLGSKLEAAIEAATAKKPAAEVKKRVQAVLAGLTAAEKLAPSSPLSPAAVKAQVAADMLDRAAAQYGVVLKDSNLETYLDGLGFAMAARMQAAEILPALRKSDAPAAAALDKGLKFAAAAYPGIKRPAKPKVSSGDFLAAASAARIAAGAIK